MLFPKSSNLPISTVMYAMLKKLRSINLLSPACSVQKVKLFMLARKKSSRYIRYKFTLKNWKILTLLLIMREIMQLQKSGKKYLYLF